jgi:mono/diheme cytochrome c family protein
MHNDSDMGSIRTAGMLLAVVAILAPLTNYAQEKLLPADVGKRDFESSCAICHGASGRGNGPYAVFHQLRIPDLTSLATRNGGDFPYRRVTEIIDGRKIIIIHGTPSMPIWGDRYKVKATEECRETHCDPEPLVRARVLALTEYIRRLNWR